MASLISKASLLMVPSVYEDGTLYNVLPSGNKAPDETGNHNGYDQTRADFTFSRDGSGASKATRITASGLIEKGRENLLLQSNQFDTTWTKSNATLTSGQSGYDGNSNAWKIEATATLANLTQSVSSSGVNTFSVYAKAGTEDGIFLRVDGGNNPRCFYNIKDGVVGNPSGSPVETSMEDLGNGWYRCKLVVNSAITAAKIYVANDSNGFPSSGSVFIQDAQLEKGLVATDYIETTTAAASAGLLGDMPRLDYSGGASSASLLLEPSRTNKIPYSEYFGQSLWNKNQVNVEFGYLAPDGTNSAYKITDTSGTNSASLYYGGILGTDSRSIWARTTSGTGSLDLMTYFGNTNNTFTITEEWQRFDVSSVTTSVGETNFYAVDFRGGGLTEVILWGAQVEAGSYPTSYIPTYGTAVARAVDTFEVTGISDLIDSQGGVMLLETQALDSNQGYSGISLSDDTFTNNAQIRYGSATDQIQVQYRVGSSNECLASNSENNITNNLKIAFKYEANSFKMFVNGVLEATDTSGSVNATNTFDTIKSNRGDGNDKYLGKLKQLVVFPTALTDAECISLTTL